METLLMEVTMEPQEKVTPDGLRVVKIESVGNMYNVWITAKADDSKPHLIAKNVVESKARKVFEGLSNQRDVCGYTNWDTFAWVVYPDNDRYLYALKNDVLNECTSEERPVAASDVKRFESRLLVAKRDTEIEKDLIDWEEIAESWEIDRQEMIEYEGGE